MLNRMVMAKAFWMEISHNHPLLSHSVIAGHMKGIQAIIPSHSYKDAVLDRKARKGADLKRFVSHTSLFKTTSSVLNMQIMIRNL